MLMHLRFNGGNYHIPTNKTAACDPAARHVVSAPTSSPRPSHDKVDLPPAAPRANEPLVPVANRGAGAISPRQLAGIGLDLMAA
jgi:hypothetical protein